MKVKSEVASRVRLLATGALSHIVDPGSKLRLQHSLAVIYILPAEGGLEKEMATHSGILAWRIPGTGEPGRLPSMGLHRVDTTEAT